VTFTWTFISKSLFNINSLFINNLHIINSLLIINSPLIINLSLSIMKLNIIISVMMQRMIWILVLVQYIRALLHTRRPITNNIIIMILMTYLLWKLRKDILLPRPRRSNILVSIVLIPFNFEASHPVSMP